MGFYTYTSRRTIFEQFWPFRTLVSHSWTDYCLTLEILNAPQNSSEQSSHAAILGEDGKSAFSSTVVDGVASIDHIPISPEDVCILTLGLCLAESDPATKHISKVRIYESNSVLTVMALEFYELE